MAAEIEIRMPSYPVCWDTCGACYSGSVEVAAVLVGPGDHLGIDDPVIELELDKTTLEIPTSRAGEVLAVHVSPGDTVEEGALILTLRGA